jgi:hypothetical protein
MHVVVSHDEAPTAVAHSEGTTSSGMMIGALAGGEASASHVSLEQEECKITIFLRTPENRDKEKIVLQYICP